MSEQRLDRLDRTVTRLMQAQQKALETCEQTLDYDDEILDDVDEFMEPPSPRPSAEGEQLYRAALEDVRATLVSASEDVQEILGEGDGSGD
jgi:hypothetical protein